jgi:hypothetical protein
MTHRIRDMIADLIGATALAVILCGGLFIAAFAQPVHIETPEKGE